MNRQHGEIKHLFITSVLCNLLYFFGWFSYDSIFYTSVYIQYMVWGIPWCRHLSHVQLPSVLPSYCQYVRDLWWTNWHWCRYSSEYFSCLLTK